MYVSVIRAAVCARPLALLILPLALAGCVSTAKPVKKGPDPMHLAMYGPHPEEKFPLPAMDIARVDPKYFRQQVAYPTSEVPGTIVVDTADRFLYLVQENGMAMRYGIGVGKAGLEFEGSARIGRKAEWPRWTPTPSMIKREPERNAKWASGMEPGLTNPLGPRALYLYQGKNDTLFRIHGTSEPWSIGKAVSSGCIRLFNQDIIDLYGRVPVNSRVVVIQQEAPMNVPAGGMPIASTAMTPPAAI
ncbi:L,D-transpeptidase [Rhizobium sp. ARZ01]|uniref:L,D-transpeptidase n=1 Tax=Rhizobium sp. ARZ01 TaxID=2769313 RepID=UPI00177E2405|nr:L,D-transpeptidase [Rhizobium sp. ARZ01]MBD9371643.1 L,D-transpeptidase [Rhizobium sp. ARZ01]